MRKVLSFILACLMFIGCFNQVLTPVKAGGGVSRSGGSEPFIYNNGEVKGDKDVIPSEVSGLLIFIPKALYYVPSEGGEYKIELCANKVANDAGTNKLLSTIQTVDTGLNVGQIFLDTSGSESYIVYKFNPSTEEKTYQIQESRLYFRLTDDYTNPKNSTKQEITLLPGSTNEVRYKFWSGSLEYDEASGKLTYVANDNLNKRKINVSIRKDSGSEDFLVDGASPKSSYTFDTNGQSITISAAQNTKYVKVIMEAKNADGPNYSKNFYFTKDERSFSSSDIKIENLDFTRDGKGNLVLSGNIVAKKKDASGTEKEFVPNCKDINLVFLNAYLNYRGIYSSNDEVKKLLKEDFRLGTIAPGTLSEQHNDSPVNSSIIHSFDFEKVSAVPDGNNKNYFEIKLPLTKDFTTEYYDKLVSDLRFSINYTDEESSNPHDVTKIINPRIELNFKKDRSNYVKYDAPGDNTAYVKEENGDTYLVQELHFKSSPVPDEIKIYEHKITFPRNISELAKFKVLEEGYVLDKSGNFYTKNNIALKDPTFVNGEYVYYLKTKIDKMPANLSAYNDAKNPARTEITAYANNIECDNAWTQYKLSQNPDHGVDKPIIFNSGNINIKFPKPTSNKILISKDGDVETWAILLNENHEAKAIVNLFDNLGGGEIANNYLKYMFINKNITLDKTNVENAINDTNITKYYPLAANAKDSGAPYAEANAGELKIYFGDHSDKLLKKIYQERKNGTTPTSETNIIKYLFKDYEFMTQAVGTEIATNGQYFEDTNQINLKRNFPSLKCFEGSDTPFTSLADGYVTLKKVRASTSTEHGKYETFSKPNTTGDALLVVYKLKNRSKENIFRVNWLNNYPNAQITEPLLGDTSTPPSLTVDQSTLDTTENGSSRDETEDGLYKSYKHSVFDKNNSNLVHYGIIANIKGNSVNKINIYDKIGTAVGLVQVGEFTNKKLYKISKDKFEEKIKKLSQSGSTTVKPYDAIIESLLDGSSANDFTAADFKANMTGIDIDNAENYVYFYLYDANLSYDFTVSKSIDITNGALVRYDNKDTEVKSKLAVNNFVTKEDITDDSGINNRKYKITLDFNKLNISDEVEEIEIKDIIGIMLDTSYITVSNDKFRNISIESPNNNLHCTADNNILKIKKDPSIKNKGFINDQNKIITIEYNCSFDLNLWKLQGALSVKNRVDVKYFTKSSKTETLDSAEVQKSVNISSSIISKSVVGVDNTTAKNNTRSYTVGIDLSKNPVLKKEQEILVEDYIDCYDGKVYKGRAQEYVSYSKLRLVDDNNQPITGLNVEEYSNSNLKTCFKITKNDVSVDFPDKINFKYDVKINLVGFFKNFSDRTLKNTATIIIGGFSAQAEANTYIDKDPSITPAKEAGFFNLNVEKSIAHRTDKPWNYDADNCVSFKLEGQYYDKNDKLKTYGPKTYLLNNFRAIFADLPIRGKYILTEHIDFEKSKYKKYGYENLQDYKNDFLYNFEGNTDNISRDSSKIISRKIIIESNSFNDKTKSGEEFTITSNLLNDGEKASIEKIEFKVESKNFAKLDNNNGTITLKDQKNTSNYAIEEISININNKLKPINKHTISFYKVDEKGNGLNGAKFELYKMNYTSHKAEACKDANGNVVVSVSSDATVGSETKAGVVTFENLENGTYHALEVEAPSGYVLPTGKGAEVYFDIREENSEKYFLNNFQGELRKVENKKLPGYPVKFKKVDAEDNSPIVGAKFKLKNNNDKKEYEAVSDKDGIITFAAVPVGTYTLYETEAPIKYKTINPPGNKVKDGINITTQDAGYEYDFTVNANDYIKNDKKVHKVTFTKLGEDDKDTTKVVEGAEFKLQKYNADTQSYKDVRVNNKLSTATSDANGIVKFEGLNNEKYRIVETKAGSDYDINKVVYKNKDKEAGYKTDKDGYEFDLSNEAGDKDSINLDDYASDKNHGVIFNVKPRTNIKFKKVGEGEDSEKLAGVTFTLYKESENTPYQYRTNDDYTIGENTYQPATVKSDNDGKFELKNIECGEYILKEELDNNNEKHKAYLKGDDITVKVERKDGDFVITLPSTVKESADGNDKLYIIKNEKKSFNVTFTKYAEDYKDETKALEGAKFKLQKFDAKDKQYVDVMSNGNVLTASSNASGKVEFKGLVYGKYRIVEQETTVDYDLSKTIYQGGNKYYEFDLAELAKNNNDGENINLDTSATNKIYGLIFNVKPRTSLEFTKVDKETDKTLKDVEFTLYRRINGQKEAKPYQFRTNGDYTIGENTYKDATVKSGDDGKVKFTNIEYGDYVLVESNYAGYLRHADINITISRSGVIGLPDDMKVSNEVIRVDALIKKVDKYSRSGLANATFKLQKKDEDASKASSKDVYVDCKVDGELVTATSDAAGIVRFKELNVGKYRAVEIGFPRDYLNVEKYTDFEVGQVSTNDAIDFTSTNIVDNEMILSDVYFTKVDSGKRPLSGAEFELLVRYGSEYVPYSPAQIAVSDREGRVLFRGLPNGDYAAKEVRAPRGYLINKKLLEFNLDVQNEVSNNSAPIKIYENNGIFINEKEVKKPIENTETTEEHKEENYAHNSLLNKRDHFAYLYGYKDGSFGKYRNMTRAEVAAMFGRLLLKKDRPSIVYQYIYSDVKASDWFASAVTLMTRYGLIKGYPDGTFRPNAPITRAEFAAMASRFENLSLGSVSFSDVDSSYWAYSSIASACAKGWVSGYPDGTFKPTRKITREEVVAVTNRMLERKCDLNFVENYLRMLKEGTALPGSIELIMFKDNLPTSWSYGDIIEATNGHNFKRKGFIEEHWYFLNGKKFDV